MFEEKTWVIEKKPLGPPADAKKATPLGKGLNDLEERIAAGFDDLAALAIGINVKDAVFGAKGDNATDDAAAIQAALDAAATAGGGIVVVPTGTYIIGATLEIDNKVTLLGTGWKSSILKLKNGAKTSVLKSKRYGAGGTTGGTDSIALRHLGFDGNKANNAGSTAAVVDLDGIRPTVDWVEIKNGYINLRSTMSRGELSSTKLEDGRFSNIGLIGSEAFNFLFEGPHDSQVSDLLAQTNSGVNVSIRSTSQWTKCHAYGNADYAYEMLSGHLFGSVGEGAKLAQVIILKDGLILRGCRFFSAGGSDGKVGIKFGDATHTAFQTRLENVDIEGCTNGSLDFTAQNGAGSRITGKINQASGERILGTPSSSILWSMGYSEGSTRGGTPEVYSLASAAILTLANSRIFTGHPLFAKVTGTKSIEEITPMMPGQLLTLLFTSTAKLLNGKNLTLGADFQAAANSTLTLVCDGSNWYPA